LKKGGGESKRVLRGRKWMGVGVNRWKWVENR